MAMKFITRAENVSEEALLETTWLTKGGPRPHTRGGQI
jgi:hypothetical protein